MGSERSLYKTLNKNMKSYWRVQRVENLVGPGTPDLFYTINQEASGWIELKHIENWPKNSSTVVQIKHYTPQQRNWIRKFGLSGANVFLLLQGEKEYMIFDWVRAVTHVGFYSKPELRIVAIGHWKNRINYDELRKILS
jgi:hypothetical protein